MTSIRENIREYERSCMAIQRRIDELSAMISGEESSRFESLKALESRRYQLYSQHSEMRSHIRALRDYLDNTEAPPV